jgi:heterodisulfide reductase subunit A-like polyferredoxin
MTHRILAALALIALAGCASLPASVYDDVDHARVAAVERAATLHGVKVLWINLPHKSAAGG